MYYYGTSKETLFEYLRKGGDYKRVIFRLEAHIIFEAVLFEHGYSYNHSDERFRIPRPKEQLSMEKAEQLLKDCKKLLSKTDKNLKKIGNVVKEQGIDMPKELKNEIRDMELTRTELSKMGITLKSELSCKLADLPKEARELLQTEIADSLEEKVILLLNDTMTKEKREDASLKDGVSSLKSVYQMMRLSQDKSTSNSAVKHDLSSLVSKESMQEMNDIFTEEDMKDAEIIDVESDDEDLGTDD